MNSDMVFEDGGGGYKATFPEAEKRAARSLREIGEDLIRAADDALARKHAVRDHYGYQEWRSRTLRTAASLVFEVVGQPSKAAEALRGA